MLEHSNGWGALLLQVVFANLAMSGVLLYLHKPLEWWFSAGTVMRIAWLATTIAAAGAAYLIVLLALGLRPAKLRLKT